jgi:hypothetical protein
MEQNKFLRMEKREEKMKKNKAYQANLIESLRDPLQRRCSAMLKSKT